MSVIIAKNQTAGDLSLTQISSPNGVIPASGQVTLTDYNFAWRVLVSSELYAYVNSDDVVLNVNGDDLSKAVALAAFYLFPVRHEDVLDIQGGTGNEYYHLENQEHSELTDFRNAVEKTTIVDADWFLMQDSEGGWERKKFSGASLVTFIEETAFTPANFVDDESNGVDTTSSPDWQIKLTITPGAGVWLIWAVLEILSSVASQGTAQFVIAGTTWGSITTTNNNVYQTFASWKKSTLTAGQTVELQYRRIAAGSCSVRNARLFALKLSD